MSVTIAMAMSLRVAMSLTAVVVGEAEVDGRAAMAWVEVVVAKTEVDGRGRPWLEGPGVPPAQHGEAARGRGGAGDAPAVVVAAMVQGAVAAVMLQSVVAAMRGERTGL